MHESMFNDRAPSVVSRASSRRQSVHFDANAAYAEIMQTKQDEEFLARYHRDYDHVNQGKQAQGEYNTEDPVKTRGGKDL